MDLPRNLLVQSQSHWIASLIGRLHTNTQENPNDILRGIRQKWNLRRRLDIVVLEENNFILRFEKEQDKQRILRNQPWQILGYLLVLKPFGPNLVPRNIDFNTSPFWITFVGLKLEHQLSVVIERIAAATGRVLKVFPPDNAPRDADGYKARVMIVLNQSLTQGIMVQTVNHGPTWIGFEYIGLPYHNCGNCFMLAHDTYK
ncbi:hypothetical protein IFM89_005565 [Coptis chinensis]|uniref:DUF4283 domain-containing protein n=1 Tax=Coptis chinensis TaxID=261450 RepID=A0A835H4Z9_9MAGN|nr:hypothetical protein IFM89_005565 [Coptis chinensis]